MNCIFAALYWARGERGRCLRIFFFFVQLGSRCFMCRAWIFYFIFRFLGVGLMLGIGISRPYIIKVLQSFRSNFFLSLFPAITSGVFSSMFFDPHVQRDKDHSVSNQSTEEKVIDRTDWRSRHNPKVSNHRKNERKQANVHRALRNPHDLRGNRNAGTHEVDLTRSNQCSTSVKADGNQRGKLNKFKLKT